MDDFSYHLGISIMVVAVAFTVYVSINYILDLAFQYEDCCINVECKEQNVEWKE